MPGTDLALAAATVAHYARDEADLTELLQMLALPDPRVPQANHTDHQEGGEVDAYNAVAVSMYKDGHPVVAITEATGLSSDEIAAAMKATARPPAPTIKAAAIPPAASPAPDTVAPQAPAPLTGTEELLAWGEQHTSSRVQTLAARARTSLAELAQARGKEQAVAAIEARVKELQEQLAKAQSELRETKTGSAPPAAAEASKYSREDRTRIRQWARQNGHEVADTGIIPRRIYDAYETATTPRLAVAG